MNHRLIVNFIFRAFIASVNMFKHKLIMITQSFIIAASWCFDDTNTDFALSDPDVSHKKYTGFNL
jgi:hypothetical protein